MSVVRVIVSLGSIVYSDSLPFLLSGLFVRSSVSFVDNLWFM